MIYIPKGYRTVLEAQMEFEKIKQFAYDTLMPENMRRLNQRRNLLNSSCDRMLLVCNVEGRNSMNSLKDRTGWEDLGRQVSEVIETMRKIKESIQTSTEKLY